MSDSTTITAEDRNALYDHWMKIWDIIPEEVRARFRHEHGCVLCEGHKAYLADVQRQVRHDKMVKAAEMSKREAEKENQKTE